MPKLSNGHSGAVLPDRDPLRALSAAWAEYDSMCPAARAALDDRRMLPVPETRRLLRLALSDRSWLAGAGGRAA
jgi:hypothetical protein